MHFLLATALAFTSIVLASDRAPPSAKYSFCTNTASECQEMSVSDIDEHAVPDNLYSVEVLEMATGYNCWATDANRNPIMSSDTSDLKQGVKYSRADDTLKNLESMKNISIRPT